MAAAAFKHKPDLHRASAVFSALHAPVHSGPRQWQRLFSESFSVQDISTSARNTYKGNFGGFRVQLHAFQGETACTWWAKHLCLWGMRALFITRHTKAFTVYFSLLIQNHCISLLGILSLSFSWCKKNISFLCKKAVIVSEVVLLMLVSKKCLCVPGAHTHRAGKEVVTACSCAALSASEGELQLLTWGGTCLIWASLAIGKSLPTCTEIFRRRVRCQSKCCWIAELSYKLGISPPGKS